MLLPNPTRLEVNEPVQTGLIPVLRIVANEDIATEI